MKILENMALREKDLWAELFVDVVVALYYFPRVFALMREGDELLRSSQMLSTVISSIILAIVVSIVVFGTLHWQDPKLEKKDERDYRFEAQGSRNAYVSLNILLGILISIIISVEYFSGRGLGSFFVNLGPIGIANLILLAMIGASFFKAATQLISYRRGF